MPFWETWSFLNHGHALDPSPLTTFKKSFQLKNGNFFPEIRRPRFWKLFMKIWPILGFLAQTACLKLSWNIFYLSIEYDTFHHIFSNENHWNSMKIREKLKVRVNFPTLPFLIVDPSIYLSNERPRKVRKVENEKIQIRPKTGPKNDEKRKIAK